MRVVSTDLYREQTEVKYLLGQNGKLRFTVVVSKFSNVPPYALFRYHTSGTTVATNLLKRALSGDDVQGKFWWKEYKEN